MAATQTVPQISQSGNLIRPRHGVVTLYGHGIAVYVDRGHLVLKDGICGERREARLPRVGHGLRRLVVIGSDGFVSLAALRWLAADQGAAFVMLERDGSVLATTGPVRPSDARLRRAQSLATSNGVALTLPPAIAARSRLRLSRQETIKRIISVILCPPAGRVVCLLADVSVVSRDIAVREIQRGSRRRSGLDPGDFQAVVVAPDFGDAIERSCFAKNQILRAALRSVHHGR